MRVFCRHAGVEKNRELLARDSQQFYAALTKEFEAAFPGYAISYMIQYGAYGLVSQL